MKKTEVIQTRCTRETKEKTRKLSRVLSKELGIKVTVTDVIEMAVNDLAAKKKVF